MKAKSLILMGLGILFLNTTEARPQLVKNILVEKTLSVGFAPEEHRGIYRFQVLKSGVVQNVDNKNKVTKLALLSPAIIDKIQTAVRALPNDLKIVQEDGPRCADAPSSQTTVVKSNGVKITIRSRVDCLPSNAINSTAVGLANWTDSLDNSLNTHFVIESSDAPARIGQEGYSAPPSFRDSKKFLRCEEEFPVADDGFSLYVEEITGKSKEYNLVVERSLLMGPETESYVVENKTDPRLAGSPARYENEIVKLSVQGTTTPRPDGKLNGSFVKQGLHGNTEIRNLLCSYSN
jgi:hypothetical protein